MKNAKIYLLATLLLMPAFLFPDADIEYNRARLSIEYKSGIRGAWTQYGGGVSTYSYWKYYQGFDEISEKEFLEIAGYLEEANIAMRHQTVSTGLAFGGLASAGVGTLVLTFGITLGEPNWGALGGALTGGGLAAIVLWITRGYHWLPLQQAYAIAADYNEKLRESLRE